MTVETTVEEKLRVFASIVDKENNLISQRMTWLMTLNSFVIGAVAVLASSADANDDAFSVAIIVATTLGSMSNFATFFSNYWAEIAIQEADIALRGWLTDDEKLHSAALLRLYGRDPTDQAAAPTRPTFIGKSTPLTLIIHPWFCLPALFWLTLTLGGLLATADPMNAPIVWALLPSLLLSGIAALIILVESRRRRRRK